MTKVAKILHSVMDKQNSPAGKVSRYFEYGPEKVLENDSYIIYWNRTLLSYRAVHHNQPDITKQGQFIDIAVVNTNNLQKTLNEKCEKYVELKEAIFTQWNLTTIRVVPIVISATGNVPIQTVNWIN